MRPKHMADNDKVLFRNEGEPAFPVDTENDNSAESPSDQTTMDTGEDPSNTGNEKKPDAEKKEVPFDQHPAWKEREQTWDKRFNEQERRHQDDLAAIRTEFGAARKDNADQTKIPSWFGGDQAAWDAYRSDRDAELKSAEDRAYARVNQEKSTQDKAVKEATDYMQAEMATIESDKTLNPTGAKIDPNKLLKIVIDNDLVDSKGRWNYRAGFAILQSQTKTAPKGDRKVLAGASTSDDRPETKPTDYKTSVDFKKPGARPW